MKHKPARPKVSLAAKEVARLVEERMRQRLTERFLPPVIRSAEERKRLAEESAKAGEDQKVRDSRAARQRPLKDKLVDAAAHLETGLQLLREILQSPDFPRHDAGDIHGNYETTAAITTLAQTTDNLVNELCAVARNGQPDATRQVWESASRLAGVILEIAEASPQQLVRVAPSAEAMPVLWHRKAHRKGHRKLTEHDKLLAVAKRIGLGKELVWDLDGKSQYEGNNAKLVLAGLKRWHAIQRNLRWRRACAKLRRTQMLTSEHLKSASEAGVLSPEEARLFEKGLKLKRFKKGQKKLARPWASEVLVPWLNLNKEESWLKALVPDGKFDSPSAFAQILAGLARR